MKAVLLDADTLGDWQDPASSGGVDLSPVSQLFDQFEIYGQTEPSQVLARCADCEVIITNKVVLDRALLEQLPNLQVIQLTATGMNNLDLNACQDLNIQALNVEDYSTYTVAQLTLQFMLNFATRTIEHDRLTKSGAWQASRIFTLTNYPTIELANKNLVIIGQGNIGKKVAQLAQAFGMKVSFAQLPNRPVRTNQEPLMDAVQKADFISLHCPLSPETQQLVDSEFLQQMKLSAYLINTARGPIINETDLAKALQNKMIAGAALDVLSQEPPTADNPLLNKPLNNLVLTPHIAWASQEAKVRLIDKMATNLTDYLSNNNLPNRR
ncbi:D-2-hydroxyacid dehydrogenase [Kangiella sp. TOML190]|uniref:D-2-hydroxyacid dehydrogenase n=1 Tax=Kangiella sp. TOML190 TaxID=2931351 RepID=UPI0020412223|nr:D-2-hydroxyacid dehydrogenase [Kangiella sp. TOML190]